MISYCPEYSAEYYYCMQGLLLKYSGPMLKRRSSVDGFVELLTKEFPDTKKYCVSYDTVFEHKDFIVIIGKGGGCFDICGYVRDHKTLEKISRIGKGAYDSENVDMNIMSFDFYMCPTGVAYDNNYLVTDSAPSRLYIPYIDTDVMFERFFKSSENILLLTGRSGIGKSKLGALAIEYLSKHTEKVTANVASTSDVNVLSNDSFWGYLVSEEIDLVILDDLDFMLTPRSEEQTATDVIKNRFVSNFLSFTDGFKKNTVKFIITTNQTIDTIDASLLRKGRMFDILELRELTNKEARDVWNHYTSDKPFKLKGSVLACDLAHEIESTLNGADKRSYLRDPSVSKLEKSGKSIGF